jgi:hypothetical protein
VRNYPADLDGLTTQIGELNLSFMAQDLIANLTGKGIDTIVLTPFYPVSVFHSAVAMFFAPSDPSGSHEMRRKRIHSAPSWYGGEPCRDCAFVVTDQVRSGMRGMAVVRVLLFFSVQFDQVCYPCALVEWFQRVRHDPSSGMWIVCPDRMCGRQDKSVLHLDSFLRAAHLIPVYGHQMMPLDFQHYYSLDIFEGYYVNKYIDHHAYEIAF